MTLCAYKFLSLLQNMQSGPSSLRSQRSLGSVQNMHFE